MHLARRLNRHAHGTIPIGFVVLLRFAIVLSVLFITSTGVGASDVSVGGHDDKGGLKELLRNIEAYGREIGAELNERILSLRINTDPVLRQIVCRLPYHGIEVTEHARNLGISEIDVWKAGLELNKMGLVDIRHFEQFRMLIPKSEAAKEMMRRWAERWCVTDESCRVEH